jgi:hypothetical protein
MLIETIALSGWSSMHPCQEAGFETVPEGHNFVLNYRFVGNHLLSGFLVTESPCQVPMPACGAVHGSEIRHIAMPLPKTRPLKLKVVGA